MEGSISITILQRALYISSLIIGSFSSKCIKNRFDLSVPFGIASSIMNNSGSPLESGLMIKDLPTTFGAAVVPFLGM